MAHTITVLRVGPGKPEAHLIDLKPQLRSLRDELGGGFLESIALDHGSHAYVDEDGKGHGLPANESATALARALGWAGHEQDHIVGTALFMGHSYGLEVDVPAEVLTAARRLKIKVVDLR